MHKSRANVPEYKILLLFLWENNKIYSLISTLLYVQNMSMYSVYVCTYTKTVGMKS
jgi:hypothetical protein